MGEGIVQQTTEKLDAPGVIREQTLSFVCSVLLAATLSIGSVAPAAEDLPTPANGLASPDSQTDTGEIRSRLKDGQKIVVIDDAGGKFEGRVAELKGDALTLRIGGERTDVRYDRIVRIDRPHDGVGNGALIGFGVGAGLGLVSALAAAGDDSGWGSPDSMDVATIGSLVLGGIGAAIGLGLDAATRRDPTLYRRQGVSRVSLSPSLGRSRRGLAISVSW